MRLFYPVQFSAVRTSLLSALLVAWTVTPGAASASAAQPAMDPSFVIPAVRADAPLHIDGRLDDAVWRDAPMITGFTDVDLRRPAVHQTLVRVLYDDEHIYFGFEMLAAEPSKIQATERRRDRSRLRFEDYIQVSLDTFLDRRRSYMFLVSPLGTQWDARDGVFGRHETWDATWAAATTIGGDR